MHEVSLCRGLLSLIEEHAAAQGVARVKSVVLEVGALAGVELEALRFAFDVVMKDTLADGAALEINTVPGQAQCGGCGQTVAIERRFDPCPLCGGQLLDIVAGDELRLYELEVV